MQLNAGLLPYCMGRPLGRGLVCESDVIAVPSLKTKIPAAGIHCRRYFHISLFRCAMTSQEIMIGITVVQIPEAISSSNRFLSPLLRRAVS